MNHDFSLVFETDNEYWKRVLDIFERNEQYPKKIVKGRNLHHKFPRSFSKKFGEEVDNDKDNLISLSLADHFLVHYYYYKLAKKGYRQSMATAFIFMAKKFIKYMSPDTAEMISKDYEAVKKYMSEQQKGKPHPHKAGFQSEEKGRKISEASKLRTPESRLKTDFGKKFYEHFNLQQIDNKNLYSREYVFYRKFGKCSWE